MVDLGPQFHNVRDENTDGTLFHYLTGISSSSSTPYRATDVLYFARGPSSSGALGSGMPYVLSFEAVGSPTIVLAAAVEIPAGVILQIGAGVTLVFKGSFTAPVQQVFDVSGGGAVQLLCPSLEAIYPEWWGAGSGIFGESDDQPALQAAVNAAFRDRILNSTDLAPLATVPIVLPGWYILGSPLVIGVGDRNLPTPSGSFILRGAYGGSQATDTPSVLTAAGSFAALPLVRIQNASGFLIECVSFDGGGVARSCVAIDGSTVLPPDATVDNLPGDAANGQFHVCAFRNAAAVLVEAGSVAGATQAAATLAGSASPVSSWVEEVIEGIEDLLGQVAQDVSGLSFQSCQFTATESSAFAPVTGVILQGAFAMVPATGSMTGRSYALPRSANVDFTNCVFDGVARAMIHACGGSVYLASCTFFNSISPSVVVRSVAPPLAVSNTPSGFPDVFLDFPFPSFAAGIGPPATITVSDCLSRSPSFLETAPGSAGPGPSGNSVLMNVMHHQPSGTETSPPSVLWRLSSPGNQYSLSLVGCSLAGSVDMTAVADADSQPVVVNVGNTPTDPTVGVSMLRQLHPRSP